MRKSIGLVLFVYGGLFSTISLYASGSTSVTTSISGSTTSTVKAGSTVVITLCSTVNGISTCAGLTKPVALTCPVITLKQGPQTLKASCSTGFKPTAFSAAITVNGVACAAASGLIGGSTSCSGVTVKVGK
jgi:hypothetical protein